MRAQIVYNNTTGDLFYDARVTGAAAQVKFAVLTPGTVLTVNYFIL